MSEPEPSLTAMAEAVGRALGRFHPGRPAFSALSRAQEARRAAAQEVARFEQAYGRSDGGHGAPR